MVTGWKEQGMDCLLDESFTSREECQGVNREAAGADQAASLVVSRESIREGNSPLVFR